MTVTAGNSGAVAPAQDLVTATIDGARSPCRRARW